MIHVSTHFLLLRDNIESMAQRLTHLVLGVVSRCLADSATLLKDDLPGASKRDSCGGAHPHEK